MACVSIIVPVYNTERYLRECLDSLIRQTLDDIEIVCVNDGSTDGSTAILEEYAQLDRRFAVVQQQNCGLAAARNTGVAAATGEYLDFLDSDDHLDPKALEVLYSRAKAHNLDVIYFGAASFFDPPELESLHAGYVSYYERSAEYPGTMTGRGLLAAMAENGDYRPSACLQLIRAEFYRDAALSFREGIIHEDNLFTFQCALLAGRAEYLPLKLYQRRVRESSIMTTRQDIVTVDGYYTCYLEMLKSVIGREELSDFEKRAVVQIAMPMYKAALKAAVPLSEQELTAAAERRSPEYGVGFNALTQHRSDLLKLSELQSQLKASKKEARRLRRELAATTERLERIRNSRAFRAIRSLRAILRIGN